MATLQAGQSIRFIDPQHGYWRYGTLTELYYDKRKRLEMARCITPSGRVYKVQQKNVQTF